MRLDGTCGPPTKEGRQQSRASLSTECTCHGEDEAEIGSGRSIDASSLLRSAWARVGSSDARAIVQESMSSNCPHLLCSSLQSSMLYRWAICWDLSGATAYNASA